MRREVKIKSNAIATLTWIHDWIYRKVIEEEPRFEVQDFSPHMNLEIKDFSLHTWLSELPRESMQVTDKQYHALLHMKDEDFIHRLNQILKANTRIDGKLSDLFINERQLSLFALAQYSIEFSPQDVMTPLNKFPVISLKCYDIGQYRTQIIASCFPEAAWLIDQLWGEMLLVFECVQNNGISNSIPQPTKQIEPEKILHEINDPTDLRIWNWIKENPSLTDTDLGQKLGISRQSVNTRRRRIESMGYAVRVSRQK